MTEKAFLVKAFTTDPEGGNPAGVISEADHLSPAQMLRIAQELGFSESAFVQHSDQADFRLRFFSATQEVGFCAHATIAAFHSLNENGLITVAGASTGLTQETQVGVLKVKVARDGLITMTQTQPQFLEVESDKKKIAALLNIKTTDLLNYPLETVSTGTPKMMIPVVSLNVLKRIKPDLEGIKNYCQNSQCRGFYPFTAETLNPDHDFFARQFNPLAGINEDPITGVAAGALGCYVHKHVLSPKNQLVVEQGYFMNKGGTIFVSVGDGVEVGGYAVTFGEKEISVA